jgi:hypothetical protein
LVEFHHRKNGLSAFLVEGTWSLASLEVVDASGGRRKVNASGQLSYDVFGNMAVRGVIEDPALRSTLVLDFNGRIVIDRPGTSFARSISPRTGPSIRARSRLFRQTRSVAMS